MDKPISIIIEEARNKLADTVNGLGLSPTILEPIIREMYVEIQQLQKQELAYDKKKYEEYLKTIENKETEEVSD